MAMNPSSALDDRLHYWLHYFKNSANGLYPISKYSSYVQRIVNEANNSNINIFDILYDNIKNKKDPNPVQTIVDIIDEQVIKPSINITSTSKSSYKTGFKAFVKCVIGFYKADIWFSVGKEDNNLYLCRLVAQNALFASKEVLQSVKNGQLGTKENIGYGNDYYSWDHMSSIRDLKNKNKTIPNGIFIDNKCYNNVKGDDNNCANRYIKQAVIQSFKKKHGDNIIPTAAFFDGYEACHIWDMPSDPRYYTSIANLVLLPSALAQLTDDNDAVEYLLRYHVQEEFGFIPQGKNRLQKPVYYDKVKWREY